MMRIILDLQACQSGSRFRGVGRYSISLNKYLARKLIDRGHEVIVVLSKSFPDQIDEVMVDFNLSIPEVRFFEFSIPVGCAAARADNQWRQIAGRILREHAIACLEPDIVYVPALLSDGWDDDFVASVGLLGVHIPTAMTLYDLIPLVMSEIYFADDRFHDYYMNKIDYIGRADLIFTISEYTTSEAKNYLNLKEGTVFNISGAVSDNFSARSTKPLSVNDTLCKYGIKSDFLLYVPGGIDPRKNIIRLLEAYSLLPSEIRESYVLVIASKIPAGFDKGLYEIAGKYNIDETSLILTNYVSDADLVDLYHSCYTYVFPSLYEGFGLSVLEAMSCGAVVIASSCTSIPEIHGFHEALFDPYSVQDIKDKIIRSILDQKFRASLKEHAGVQAAKFSWQRSALIATEAMENLFEYNKTSGFIAIKKGMLPSLKDMLTKIVEQGGGTEPSDQDLIAFKNCYEFNLGAS